MCSNDRLEDLAECVQQGNRPIQFWLPEIARAALTKGYRDRCLEVMRVIARSHTRIEDSYQDSHEVVITC